MFKVRRGGGKEIPLIQAKEQQAALCWSSREETPHIQGERNPSKMMKNLSHPILLKRIPFCKNSRERASRKSINLTPPPESQSDPRLGPPDFTFRTYDLPRKF